MLLEKWREVREADTVQKACELSGHPFPNGSFNRRIGMGFGKLK